MPWPAGALPQKLATAMEPVFFEPSGAIETTVGDRVEVTPLSLRVLTDSWKCWTAPRASSSLTTLGMCGLGAWTCWMPQNAAAAARSPATVAPAEAARHGGFAAGRGGRARAVVLDMARMLRRAGRRGHARGCEP